MHNKKVWLMADTCSVPTCQIQQLSQWPKLQNVMLYLSLWRKVCTWRAPPVNVAIICNMHRPVRLSRKWCNSCHLQTLTFLQNMHFKQINHLLDHWWNPSLWRLMLLSQSPQSPPESVFSCCLCYCTRGALEG